jgi:tape measure domain-containing protein
MAQSYQVDIVTKVVGASKVAQLDKALADLSRNSTKVDTAARRAATSTNTLGTAAQTAGTKAKSSAAGFQTMGAAINAAAAKITLIIGAVQTFSQVMGAAFERQNAEKRLQNLTGSTAEYEAALLSAASVSQKFGISQTEATQALGDVYSRLSGVGFGLKQVTTIYEGFNTVARESGISSEAASSAFLQLGQALGSGVLQGDEMRSILEQMPQLTQMIAAEMGIAASQVKKFGSEGKVTSDIIYSALEKAAAGATDLNGKLTPAQQSMNQFNVAIDKASVALGTALIPALTGLIEAITPVISAVGTLVQKLDELGASKVFEFLMAPARAFGELVNGAAGETENLSEKAKEAVADFSSLPETAAAAKAPIEQVAGATKKIADNSKTAAEEQGKLKAKVSETVAPTKELAQQNAEIEKQIALQKTLQAAKNGETQTAVQLTQQVADGEGQAAQNAQQLASNQAGANAQINEGASAAGRLAGELERAAAASSGIGGGSFAGNSTSASYSHKQFDKYKLDSEGNIVETSAEERKRQMNQAKISKVNAQYKTAQAWDAAFAGTDYNSRTSAVMRTGGMMGVVGSQMYDAFLTAGGYDSSKHQYLEKFADGGYVTGPQQAVVGEGGEPEYIIPASKMDSAMQRYGSGMRGSSVIPESANVSVNYSGSTVDMGGTSYVNKGDVNGIVSQAVNQTLTTLQRSAGARLRAGMR